MSEAKKLGISFWVLGISQVLRAIVNLKKKQILLRAIAIPEFLNQTFN
ncbi:hypothetical protein KAOT1_05607 [Kordia algicida OT-1]|uniref:Uncharacterized protein n=1 Tax=Kordia algicida OT-1 TaxID=391587 RepID=A9E0H3_9FLAO|nr:hypothetical protein KAOT1_05607 [Kordia algicida OT-1]